MPTLNISYETLEERRDYERAIAFVAEMRQLGLQAPHGGVIDACEAMALSRGQDLLRDTLAAAVQARIDDLEKKSPRPAATGPVAKGGGRGRSSRRSARSPSRGSIANVPRVATEDSPPTA